MAKRIIYEDADGVKVIVPTPEFLANGGTLADIITKSVPLGSVAEIVEDTTIPSDRAFRDAWKKSGAKIDVDMPKARIIHMKKIRFVRDKELVKSDIQITIEMEKGAVTQALKDKRQKLRDIPQTFDLSVYTTADELKVAWPPDLPKA